MPLRFVLDANVALTWFLGEDGEQEAYALRVAERILSESTLCVVPAIWHIEVGHNLIRARRNKANALSAAKLNAALKSLDSLPLETHHIGLDPRQVVELAQRYHLSGYDAVYLHLAKTEGIAIASFDGGIRQACGAHKVALL